MRIAITVLFVAALLVPSAPSLATQYTNYSAQNATYQYLLNNEIERCFPDLVRSIVAPFGQNVHPLTYLKSKATIASNLESLSSILAFHPTGNRMTNMGSQFLIVGYNPTKRTVAFHVTANEYDGFGIMLEQGRLPAGVGIYDFQGARTGYGDLVGDTFKGEGRTKSLAPPAGCSCITTPRRNITT